MIGRMRARDLRERLSVAILNRLSPEQIRRATLFERLTVQRLSWDQVVRLNRYLALLGKVTTGVWVAFVGTMILGFDWRDAVEGAFNSGRPIKDALVVAILVPTLVFLAIRSVVGFLRWRLQRELWRRDVERVTAGVGSGR
jgi:hypothetical protein